MCVYRCALEQERRDEKCEDMCALRLRRERFLDKKIKQKHRRQKAEKRGKPRQTTDLRDFVPQGQKNKKLSPKPLSCLCLLSLSLSLVSLEDSLGDSPLRVFVVRFFPQREREPGSSSPGRRGPLLSRERAYLVASEERRENNTMVVEEGEETIESLERDVEVRSFVLFSRTAFVFSSSSSSKTKPTRASRSFFFSHRRSLSCDLSQALTIEREELLERLARNAALASTSARDLLEGEDDVDENDDDDSDDNGITTRTTTRTTTKSIRASRIASDILNLLAKREHLTSAALDVVQKMKEKRKGVFVVVASEEEDVKEEEEEAASYPFLLDELAKAVALIDQTSMMARNRESTRGVIGFGSMTSRVSSHAKNRTLAVAEECRRALTTILRRSLKRTNWPPPLTPSQLSEYEWNVGDNEGNGIVITRCCELLFVLQSALENDIFVRDDSRKNNAVYGQELAGATAPVRRYDFAAETFALAVQRRFLKAFASAQHSRAPELMLNCCAKQIEFVPSFVASALIEFINEKKDDGRDSGNSTTTSLLEGLFEKRSSSFACTIASGLSDSACALMEDVYCAKCDSDSKKWWLHLADCAIEFDDKCERNFGRFSNAPKCLDVLADRNEDWKVSWLLSELEANWNEIKPLLDSKEVGWECEASGYAEGSRDDDDDLEFSVDNDDRDDAGSLPGVTAPRVATVLATLLANLVARSEKLSDDEHRVEFLARVPALLVEKFRDAVDDKASEVEHDLFSETMDVVTSAVTRIGSCIAAALKIEETLSELSEWPFLVELVRGYKGYETNENDHDDVEGVFDDECKMFKDLRDVWIDRLANVAIGKSCDALDGYRSYASALRFTKSSDKNVDENRENASPPASPSSQFPTKASHLLLVGLPVLRSWLALLHKSLDSRAFQRAWRKICKSVSKRCFSDDIVRYLLEKQKKEMSEEGLNQFAIDVDTYVATFVPYSANRKTVALAVDRRVRDFLNGTI